MEINSINEWMNAMTDAIENRDFATLQKLESTSMGWEQEGEEIKAEVEMFGEKFRIGKMMGEFYVNYVDEDDSGTYYLRKDAYIRVGCVDEDGYPSGWFETFEEAVKTLDIYAEKKTGVPVEDATFTVKFVKGQ